MRSLRSREWIGLQAQLQDLQPRRMFFHSFYSFFFIISFHSFFLYTPFSSFQFINVFINNNVEFLPRGEQLHIVEGERVRRRTR